MLWMEKMRNGEIKRQNFKKNFFSTHAKMVKSKTFLRETLSVLNPIYDSMHLDTLTNIH